MIFKEETHTFHRYYTINIIACAGLTVYIQTEFTTSSPSSSPCDASHSNWNLEILVFVEGKLEKIPWIKPRGAKTKAGKKANRVGGEGGG